MHTLKSLIENHETVWFYCATKNLQRGFLEQAENEGFVTLNGQKPTELFDQYFYGINDDMSMGYLSNMIWCLTFQTGGDTHVRVDYEKYITDEDDYICHESPLRRIRYTDWNKLAYRTLDSDEFEKQCENFIVGQTYEEYQAYVYRFLMESSWHYTPEQAVERMKDAAEWISQCYQDKVAVVHCAVEVGYSCG